MGSHKAVTAVPIDYSLHCHPGLEPFGVFDHMQDPALAANGVDDLDLPLGRREKPDVAGLTASTGVKNRTIENDTFRRDFSNAPFGSRPVGVAGGDLFGGHLVTLRPVRLAITCFMCVLACGGTGVVDLPDNYREQLHAVTGHDPAECTDLRSVEAVITITDAGISPDCAIVGSAQDVSIVNEQASDDTWIVADPPTQLELARHTRLVFEVPAGTTEVVERIGDRVGAGVWVCYGRESRHQCQVVVAP
jgi:hypothetical protein